MYAIILATAFNIINLDILERTAFNMLLVLFMLLNLSSF